MSYYNRQCRFEKEQVKTKRSKKTKSILCENCIYEGTVNCENEKKKWSLLHAQNKKKMIYLGGDEHEIICING